MSGAFEMPISYACKLSWTEDVVGTVLNMSDATRAVTQLKIIDSTAMCN